MALARAFTVLALALIATRPANAQAVSSHVADPATGDSTIVALATPSWAALIADRCEPATRRHGAGILVGFVRDAGTGVMVTKARVVAGWPNGDGGLGRAEAVVDSTGAYRFCALPVGPPITVTASFGPRTRSLVVHLRQTAPQQQDIELFLESHGRLVGRVLDAATTTPVEGATVTIPGTELRRLSDTAGAFAFDSVPAGVHPVQATFPGYSNTVASVTVPGRTTVEVEIKLSHEAIVLDPITVVATRRAPSAVLEGFYRRQRRGFGFYLTRETLDKGPAQMVYQALQQVPGLHVVGAGERGARLEIGRNPGCAPTIYLDGFPFPMGEDGLDFINFTPISEIEGIEVYRGLSEIPAEFAANNPECGAIVIWTRRGG